MHTILVFPHQKIWQYSDGNSPYAGVECRWGRQQIAILDEYLALVSITVGPSRVVNMSTVDYSYLNVVCLPRTTNAAAPRISESCLCLSRFSGRVYDTWRRYAEDKLCKKVPFLVPIWRPIKISPPKVENHTSGTELYLVVKGEKTSCPGLYLVELCPKRGVLHFWWRYLDHRANFHAGRRQISVPGQKHTYFALQEPPFGATVPCCTFLESSRRANFKL